MKSVAVVVLLAILSGCEETPTRVRYFDEQDARVRAIEERRQELSRIIDMADAQLDFQLISEQLTRPGDATLRAQLRTRLRPWYVEHHPELAANVKLAISQGNIVLGMNHEQCWASMGKPTHAMHRQSSDLPPTDLWTYEDYPPFDVVGLQFTDGLLAHVYARAQSQ